jgi:hypothetical protein
MPCGDVEWDNFDVSYKGKIPNGPHPPWMDVEHRIWFRDPEVLVRNLIANPDFVDEFDYVPYHEYYQGRHRFSDFMSGDWAWKLAVSKHLILVLN